tara:strand:+ start:116 stop:400 length:285 start_codon:yes stop_codon:yes gene_type:complete
VWNVLASSSRFDPNALAKRLAIHRGSLAKGASLKSCSFRWRARGEWAWRRMGGRGAALFDNHAPISSTTNERCSDDDAGALIAVGQSVFEVLRG